MIRAAGAQPAHPRRDAVSGAVQPPEPPQPLTGRRCGASLGTCRPRMLLHGSPSRLPRAYGAVLRDGATLAAATRRTAAAGRPPSVVVVVVFSVVEAARHSLRRIRYESLRPWHGRQARRR